MVVQEWSENVVVADLPAEPATDEEIQRVTRVVRERGNCDVVMDLSGIGILRSTSLASVLRLHMLLRDCGHRLILCGITPTTRGIIEATGLVAVFEILDRRSDALAALQMDCRTPVASATGQGRINAEFRGRHESAGQSQQRVADARGAQERKSKPS